MKSFLKSIVTALLTLEAKVALKRHKPRIVAVTGNVGKTSTKDAIYAVVSAAFSARKSEKSFNSEIGLPLAILGLSNAWSSASGWLDNLWRGAKVAFGPLEKEGKEAFPEWLVLEVGADHPGDIQRAARWLRPDVVVLTRMSETPVHVEYFSGPEAILAEKMFLAKALKPGGTLVVNGDDGIFMKAVREIEGDIRDIQGTVLLYGENPESRVRIVESEVTYDKSPLSLPTGQYVVLKKASGSLKIELQGVIGRHLVYPIAAAVAVAEALDLNVDLAGALGRSESPRGRMKLLPGLSSSVIIDDTYNSSPLACMEALKTLGVISSRGRKIALLGTMKELGDLSADAHREAGGLAGETVHTLVTVGEEARLIAEGARAAGLSADRVFSVEDSRQAGALVAPLVRAGDVILLKGSQSMRMERAAAMLLADPESAPKLLVRQEEEWLGRA